MTEPELQPRPRSPRRRPRALPTALAALACFGVAFEFLAFQLKGGHDPALGAPTPASQVSARPATRIVITRVVGSSAPAGSTASSSGSAYAAAPAPVTTSSS